MQNVAFFTIILASILHLSLQTCNKKPVNVGTTLFSESDLLKDCWSTERITLLTYRMVLEDVLPSPDVFHASAGEDFVIDIVEYFKLALEVVRRISDVNSRHLMLMALSDLLGGYLNYAVLPIAKYGYYGGNLNYENTQELYELFDELKCFLRTNGEGWVQPMAITSEQLDVKPLPAETPNPGVNPCKGLIYYERLPDEVKKQAGQTAHCTFEIPMPFLDSKSHPAAIAVPFKTFSLRNLESKASSYVLVKYFMAAHKCLAYKKASAEDVSTFDNRFFTWINRFVISHLPDVKLYAAFGGVLRVYMSLKQRAGHGGSKEIGNYNVMPEVEEKEPINELEAGGAQKSHSSKDYKALIAYVVAAVLLLWFLLGGMFICYRIRAKRSISAEDRERDREARCFNAKYGKHSSSWPKIRIKSKKPAHGKCEKKSKSAGDLTNDNVPASTTSSVKSEKKHTTEFPSLNKFGRIFVSNKNEKEANVNKVPVSPRKAKKGPCASPLNIKTAKGAKGADEPISYDPSFPSITNIKQEPISVDDLPAAPPSSSTASSVRSDRSYGSAKSNGKSNMIVMDAATPSTSKSISSSSKEQTTPSASKSQAAPSKKQSRAPCIPKEGTTPSSTSKSRSSTSDPVGQSKNQQADLLEDEVSEETQTSVEKFTLVIDQSAEADFTPEEGDVSTEGTETTSEGPAVLYVHSKSAYPPTYACHTSMTGTTAKPSSSTEDTSERPECQNVDGSFILGYDFQTTSTETTSDEDASDSEEMTGNISK